MIEGSNRKKLILGAVALGVILLGGVVYALNQTGESADTNGKLQVTASFYPMAYLAERIGGEYASVTNLTPAGSEPHDFEPSARDIAKIEDADVLVLNGGIEAWGDRVVSQLSGSAVTVVVAGDGLFTEEGHGHEHEEEAGHEEEEGEHEDEGLDPHVWLDPMLYKQQGAVVLEAFKQKDPENAAAYDANYAAFAQELDALDSEFRAGLASCVSEDIVTSHTAFAYLAGHNGLHQIAINGISSEVEPSPAQLAEVADFARANGVTHIFFETLVSPKLSETIANEIGAQTLVLDPLEGLSQQNMRAGKTYFSVMRENLANLRIALECI